MNLHTKLKNSFLKNSLNKYINKIYSINKFNNIFYFYNHFNKIKKYHYIKEFSTNINILKNTKYRNNYKPVNIIYNIYINIIFTITYI